MVNIYITTTGLTPSVVLSDLGERIFNHPIIDYDIGNEFNYDELLSSGDFRDAINLGYITLYYKGRYIDNYVDFEPSIYLFNKNITQNLDGGTAFSMTIDFGIDGGTASS